MTGQIPKYGENFRLGSAEWHPEYNSSLYILKVDQSWWIRSNKGSKQWWVFHNSLPISRPMPSLTKAMQLMLDGIDEGFYTIEEN